MPVLDRLHLGRPAGLAAALDDRGDLVVDAHERQRPRRLAAAGKLFAMRTQRAQIGAGARTKLEEHGLAAGELHDVFHIVLDALNEAGRGLGELVGVLRLGDLALLGIPVPVAHGALDAVLVEQADIEPDRRIERGVLMNAEPRQVAVEILGVGGRGEIAVLQAPIGDGAADAVDKLPHAPLPLRRAVFAVKIFIDYDVRCQLAPKYRNLAVFLFEKNLAAFALDGGRPRFPLNRIKRLRHVHRTEGRFNRQPQSGAPRDRTAGRSAVTTGDWMVSLSMESITEPHPCESMALKLRTASSDMKCLGIATFRITPSRAKLKILAKIDAHQYREKTDCAGILPNILYTSSKRTTICRKDRPSLAVSSQRSIAGQKVSSKVM